MSAIVLSPADFFHAYDPASKWWCSQPFNVITTLLISLFVTIVLNLLAHELGRCTVAAEALCCLAV